ncbi:MAG: 50S ribosomal protein L4 [archaeon]
MQANVYDLDGKKVRSISLPECFETKLYPNLIKRAVLSIASKKKQPKSNFVLAGRNNTAEYIGVRKANRARCTINTGRARLPRLKNRREILYGRVAGISQSVGGPKAHPPKIEKTIIEKINKKEKKKALDSAIAATADKKLVKERGHDFEGKLEFPLVIDSKIEGLKKTAEVSKVLIKLGVGIDVENAKKKKHLRAGKGRRRGRKYKKKKSLLVILNDVKNYRAFRNLEGVDVVNVKNLNPELLAPGCKPGRLTLWSEQALKELK